MRRYAYFAWEETPAGPSCLPSNLLDALTTPERLGEYIIDGYVAQ